MSSLDLNQVWLRYGEAAILSRLNLTVRSGELVALLGPSGCGKTSILNIAAGIVRPNGGTAAIDGVPIVEPGPDRAMVFQEDALFPWLTARDNVALALRFRGVPRSERAGEADRLLARLGLTGAGDRRIWELSGGMRQRVGLARALAAQPKFLLLDEPFGALDALTRERLQELLLANVRDTGAGALLVTHDVEEALFLADRIVVLEGRPGRIRRELRVGFAARCLAGASPRAIKSSPDFVAQREELIGLVFDQVAA